MVKLIGRTIEKYGTKFINKSPDDTGHRYFVFDRPNEHTYIPLGGTITLSMARKYAGKEETKCVTAA